MSTYRGLGGVRGALQKHVDQIYGALSKQEKLAAQRIFLKLVEIGKTEFETDWKPVRRRALRSAFSEGLEQQVLKQLIDRNLLVSDRLMQANDSTVEVAHEILLTAWTTLEIWIQENRQAIALRNRLDDDVSRWTETKSEDELWSGSKLTQAWEMNQNETFNQVLGGFSENAKTFIATSVEKRDRSLRRQRNAAVAVAVLALGAGVLFVRSYISDTNTRLNDLSASSEQLLRSGGSYDSVITGIKLGKKLKQSFWGIPLLQAWWIYPSTRRKALTAMQQAVFGLDESNSLSGHSDSVNGVSVSPDGKTIASASTDGSIKLWQFDGQERSTLKPPAEEKRQDPKDKKSSATKFSKEEDKKLDTPTKEDNDKLEETNTPASPPAVYKVRYSPDGKLLAVASADNSIKLWHRDSKFPKKLGGHQGAVTDVHFSPDGKTIASASVDQTIKLWNLNGKVLKTIKGHTDGVNCVTFSPDGKLLASGSTDKTVRLWNLDGKEVDKTVTVGSVNAVRFSPDGKLLAYGRADDASNTIRVWNIKANTLRNFNNGHYKNVFAVSFSPDGKLLASAGSDNTIKLWDLDGRLLKTWQGHSGSVQDISFTPDAKQIVSASSDRSIKLWDLDTQEFPPSIGHLSSVNGISFSPDGKTIASTSGDSFIKLWGLDGQERATLREHTGSVMYVQFSPDGKVIASISRENSGNTSSGQVRLWSRDGKLLKTLQVRASSSVWQVVFFSPDSTWVAATDGDKAVKFWGLDGKELRTLGGDASAILVNSLRVSPDRKRLITFSGNTVTFWNSNGEQLQTFQASAKDSNFISDVTFSPNSQLIASANFRVEKDKSKPNNSSNIGTIQLWSLDGKLIRTMQGEVGYSSRIMFSPDGRFLAANAVKNYQEGNNVHLWSLDGQAIYTLTDQASAPIQFSPDSKLVATVAKNNAIKLWNLEGKELQALGGNSSGIFDFQFSPDGKMIASIGSGSHFFKLWNLSGDLLHMFPEPPSQRHSMGVVDVSYSPDGQLVASASDDGTIKLWTNSGQVQQTLLGHGEGVKSVSFSPDGKLIASASTDGTIKLWSLPNGKVVRTLRGHKDAVKMVRFSPDGKQLVSGSEDRTIKLWSVDGTELKTFKGHTDFVNDVSFSPNGKTIASAGGDKQIKLWNLDGKELHTFEGHTDPVGRVSFSQDGKRLASASDDKTIKLWTVEGRLLRTLKGHTGFVNSAVFSPDGKMILSGGKDQTMRLWNVEDGSQIQSVTRNDGGWVWDAKWHPNGSQIVSASGLGRLTFWNLNTPDDLLTVSCNKVRNYLATNSFLDQSDRQLCNDIFTQK
jgi:WD40 repeat protein